MAINLEDKQNVQAPDSDYPYGQIKDDTGSGDGTPVDVAVYGDFHQFFARMFALSGLTYNGLPDNDYSGFQYIEAANKLWKTFDGVKIISVTTTLTSSDISKLIIVNGASSDIDVLLPTSVSSMDGDSITVLNNGNYSVTLKRRLLDEIWYKGIGSADLLMPKIGDYVNAVMDKNNAYWYVVNHNINPNPAPTIVRKSGSLGSIASTTLIADTVISDADGKYNTTTGVYTPGVVGKINFSINLKISIVASLSSFISQLLVYRNGSSYVYFSEITYDGNGLGATMNLSGILECTNVLDEFTFEYAQTSSQTTSIVMSKTFNYIKE